MSEVHLRIALGDTKFVCKFVKKHGAESPELETDEGESLLQLACRAGERELVRFLIDEGADVNHQSVDGTTCLMETLSNSHFLIAKDLLNIDETNIFAQDDDGFQAIHIAAETGDLGILKLLIKEGAITSARTKRGISPLELAAEFGQHECLTPLLETLEEGEEKVLMIDNALTTAAEYTQDACVGYLSGLIAKRHSSIALNKEGLVSPWRANKNWWAGQAYFKARNYEYARQSFILGRRETKAGEHGWCYWQAKCDLKLGQLEQALANFAPYLAKDPNDCEVLLLIANCYNRLGIWEQSIQYLLRVVELDPTPENYYLLGEAEYYVLDYEMAVEHLEIGIRLCEADCSYRQRLVSLLSTCALRFGKQSYDKGNFAACIRFLKKVLPSHRDEEYYEVLSHAYLKDDAAGNSQLALKCLEHVRSPSLLNGKNMMIGLASVHSCDYANAIESFDKVINANPSNASALYWRCIAYYLQGRPETGISELDDLFANRVASWS